MPYKKKSVNFSNVEVESHHFSRSLNRIGALSYVNYFSPSASAHYSDRDLFGGKSAKWICEAAAGSTTLCFVFFKDPIQPYSGSIFDNRFNLYPILCQIKIVNCITNHKLFLFALEEAPPRHNSCIIILNHPQGRIEHWKEPKTPLSYVFAKLYSCHKEVFAMQLSVCNSLGESCTRTYTHTNTLKHKHAQISKQCT